MAEQTPEVVYVKQKPSLMRRILRIAGVLVFLIFLITPCFFITLATQGEIVIGLGSVPGQEMRIWLVMDADQRGIGYSTPSVIAQSDQAVCVQTNVSYALWEGEADAAVFCDCYARADANSAWELTSTNTNVCE